MEGIVNIPNWTLVPIVSWTGLWFSVPVLPQPFNRYFDWRVDRGKPFWLRVIVGYTLGCLLVYAYGTFIAIVAD